MKKKNYYLVFMLSMIGLFTIGSCSLLESDACADITCENGGTCNEGICDCPFGFLGDNCEVIDTSQIQALLDGGTTPKTLFDGGVSLEQLYGKTYEGGFIFYLNTDDGTGMVAATENQSDGAPWGCGFEEINGADGEGLGMGAQNTTDILAGCSQAGIAAIVCRDIGDEWFLPSRDELSLMYTNLHANGHGGFAADFYWSSTGDGNFDSDAWGLLFDVGLQDFFNKDVSAHVRAARAF